MDILAAELQQRYASFIEERDGVRPGLITEADVDRWAAECGGDRGRVYDEVAHYLAVGYHERQLPFAFCDAVINDLHTVITNLDDMRPDLFWQVFTAFDEGEYHRRGDKSDDPVAEHTDPAIAAIVANL
jgi:hypothetical protein